MIVKSLGNITLPRLQIKSEGLEAIVHARQKQISFSFRIRVPLDSPNSTAYSCFAQWPVHLSRIKNFEGGVVALIIFL
jgi:hypothetical protein